MSEVKTAADLKQERAKRIADHAWELFRDEFNKRIGAPEEPPSEIVVAANIAREVFKVAREFEKVREEEERER